MATYACKEIKVLAAAYGDGDSAIIDAEELLSEWKAFGRLIKRKYLSMWELLKILNHDISVYAGIAQNFKSRRIIKRLISRTEEVGSHCITYPYEHMYFLL